MLTRLVDGKRIILSSQEEAETRAEWAVSEAEAAANSPLDFKAMLQPFKGNMVSQMGSVNTAALLEIVMKQLGLADRDGKIK